MNRIPVVLAATLGLLLVSSVVISAGAQSLQNSTVEIKVSARQFEFSPKTITVQKGARVRVLITAEDTEHGFAIKELGIDQTLLPGKITTIEFVADQSGRFRIYCSRYCGDGHAEMVGELVVTESQTTTESGISVSFDENSPGVIIVESNGQRVRIDTATKSVTKLVGLTPSAAPPRAASTASHTGHPEVEPYDYKLINLPTPKRFVRHSLNLDFTHRFSEPIYPVRVSGRDLLGLDSFSVSSLGVTYGVTKKLYVSAHRSPICQPGLCRTIEIGAGYHLMDETSRSPISLSAYGSVEGDENFTDRFTFNLQLMMARSVTRYVHIFFSPAVHFNSNHDRRFDPRPQDFFPAEPLADEFRQPRHTGSFGFGVSGQIRPTVSLMFEYTPRVGFKLGDVRPIRDPLTRRITGFQNVSEPAIGFGIGKRLGRHFFSLTFSNTQTTTTSRYNSSNLVLGPSRLIIGFNLYRRFLE